MISMPYPESVLILLLFGSLFMTLAIVLTIQKGLKKRREMRMHDLPPLPHQFVVDFLYQYLQMIEKPEENPSFGSCTILRKMLKREFEGMPGIVLDYFNSYQKYVKARGSITGFEDIPEEDWYKMTDDQKNYTRITRFLGWVHLLNNNPTEV